MCDFLAPLRGICYGKGKKYERRNSEPQHCPLILRVKIDNKNFLSILWIVNLFIKGGFSIVTSLYVNLMWLLHPCRKGCSFGFAAILVAFCQYGLNPNIVM